MTRCIIYCRVSTDAQERDGTSLETQEQGCLSRNQNHIGVLFDEANQTGVKLDFVTV